MKSKLTFIFNMSPLSAFMTLISFVLFIGIYFLATVKSIEPYYFEGLLFAVPFVCFGIITFFTVTEKLKMVASSVITYILVFVFGITMPFVFIFVAFHSATTFTTNIGQYERVLKLTDYPENPLINHFPNEIPDDAEDIVYRYNPAFLQGCEKFTLKFKTDVEATSNYTEEFSRKSKWIGKVSDSETKKNGVHLASFSTDYKDLPEDFTIYLINSDPYEPNNWNHGNFSLVAISKQRNEIIFLAEDW